MRGGAQSHLMQCRDGFYVVKFRNNPQHPRVLANELVATRLAQAIGLPVPQAGIIEVPEWLIQNTPALRIVLGAQETLCESGLHYGSRYVMSPTEGQVFDYLPANMLGLVRNTSDFLGALVFDKWTCNVDLRQAVFARKGRQRKYQASFVDHGYCFNAGDWLFDDNPLRGIYPQIEVYVSVSGWESFEPWLSRVEHLDPDVIFSAANDVPPTWYDSQWNELESLAHALVKRRGLVRDLITDFGRSARHPFPNWDMHQN